jgi:hypothetical protein
MRADVLPYLVPTAGTVVWTPWMYWDGGAWSELPGSIDGWDPGTDISLQRSIQIDMARLWQETGLDDQSVVTIAVSWTSSTTGMTDTARPIKLSARVENIEATMAGARLGGTVRVRTTLTVAHAVGDRKLGVAWHPGSVIAEDEQRVALEGTLSMFPVHDLDFSHTRLPVDASWHLETSEDTTAPFMGSFRLLLNRRDSELMAAVARGSKDKRQQALCEELEAGVAMELLEIAALMRDEINSRDDWPPDSVGDVLSRTLNGAGREFERNLALGPGDVADFRTRLAAAARSAGHGRAFK